MKPSAGTPPRPSLGSVLGHQSGSLALLCPLLTSHPLPPSSLLQPLTSQVCFELHSLGTHPGQQGPFSLSLSSPRGSHSCVPNSWLVVRREQGVRPSLNLTTHLSSVLHRFCLQQQNCSPTLTRLIWPKPNGQLQQLKPISPPPHPTPTDNSPCLHSLHHLVLFPTSRPYSRLCRLPGLQDSEGRNSGLD